MSSNRTHWLWETLHDLFEDDDGFLPDVDFEFSNINDLATAYEIIRSRASCIATPGASYWSKTPDEEVPILLADNPAKLVAEGIAFPIHLVFGGIRSPSGLQVPDLGIFVFSDSVEIDYSVGTQWDELTLVGFFEILSEIVTRCEPNKISFCRNEVPSASRFVAALKRFVAGSKSKSDRI